MDKRPSSSESEDDILRLQEEFYRARAAPSAIVVRQSRPTTAPACDPTTTETKCHGVDIVDLKKGEFTQSKFKQSRKASKRSQAADQKFTISEDELWNADAPKDPQRGCLSGIIQDVQERPIVMAVQPPQANFDGGFPASFKVDQDSFKMLPKTTKTRSLFAQQFLSGNHRLFGFKTDPSELLPGPSSSSSIVTDSTMLKDTHMEEVGGDGMVADSNNSGDIHRENLGKLLTMSEEDILAEQQRLKAALGSGVVEFLTNRKHQPQQEQKAPHLLENNALSSKHVEIHDNASAHVLHKKLGIASDVVHMDCIEKEKMKWMEDLESCSNPKEITTARFNFEGILLPITADIPVDVGLHHHGDEPTAPGYSLQELFQLARSSFMKQRVFALTTLGRILQQQHSTSTREALQVNLTQILLAAGLPFLLRWSLDDDVEAVYGAALFAFKSLLASNADEDIIAGMMLLSCDCSLPRLCPISCEAEKDLSLQHTNQSDIKDAHLVQVDVIKGLLQMQLVDRIAYILSSGSPLYPLACDALSILIRICRHSTTASYDLSRNKRVINSVMSFLPLSSLTDTVDASSRMPFACPVPLAMRLVVSLCQASRSTALMFVSDCGILQRISCYISSMLSAIDAPHSDHMVLVAESFSVWKILLTYGLGTRLLSDVHTHMMSMAHALTTKLAVGQFPSVCALLENITSVLASHYYSIASNPHRLQQKPWLLGTPSPSPSKAHEMLNSALFSFHPIMNMWLESVMKVYVGGNVSVSPTLAVLLNYFACYLEGMSKANEANIGQVLAEIESIISNHVITLLESSQFQSHVLQLSAFSDLLASCHVGNELDALRCYGSDSIPETQSNVFQQVSPHRLLCGLFRLLKVACQLHKGVGEQLITVYKLDGIVNYLKSFLYNDSAAKNASTIVAAKIELQWLASLFYVFQKVHKHVDIQKDIPRLQLYHQAIFKLFSVLPVGMENEAFHLMLTSVFVPDMFLAIYENSETAVLDLGGIGLLSDVDGNSPTQTIAEYAKQNFLAIMQTYFDSCCRHIASTNGEAPKPTEHQCDSLLLPPANGPIMPLDWVFLPLLELYAEAGRSETQGDTIAEHTPQTIGVATSSLMFILLLELRKYHAVTSLSITTRLTRVLSTFLIGTNVFLEETVHSALEGLLKFYCTDEHIGRLDFEEKIPGIPSFYDLYLSLLQQYASSSYCDSLFANFLLLPLGASHPIKYRMALWGEFSHVFRVFPLKLNEVTCRLDYLFTDVEEVALLNLYAGCLAKGFVRLVWCPLLYAVAVHHLSCFLFSSSSQLDVSSDSRSSEQRSLLQLIMSFKNKDIMEDIVCYESIDANETRGFRKFTVLPPTRQLFMNNNALS